MSEKFILAKCERTNAYFGMKVEDESGSYAVTDFYDIPAAQAKTLASNLDVPNLSTAENLRTCFECGSRKVGGCDCAKRHYSCSPKMGYRYQCIYCRELHVFSAEEGAETVDETKVGTRVVLSQGQEVVISAVGGGALREIRVGVSWDIALSGTDMDVDSSVLVRSSRSGDHELIYYGNKKHPSGCLNYHGDNMKGGKMGDDEDSETTDVYLPKVPEDRDELWFVVNIYQARNRNQTFSTVRNLRIRLVNADNGKTLCEYTVSQGLMNKTGIVVGKVYRKGSSWVFKAIGNPVLADVPKDMIPYCRG